MERKYIYINKKPYTLHIAYQDDETKRKAFHAMTFDFWEFTFESYYQSGYWDENCILFSIFEGETIVAHTTLSLFATHTPTATLQLGQLGTVMTAATHTKQGLSRFLMDYIFDTYCTQLDGYFLFANDTVLDFYPKFGFVKAREFQGTKALQKQASPYTVQSLDLTHPADLQLFQHYLKTGKTACRFDTSNYGLTHFYCYANPDFGFSESLYVIPELETLVIAQQEETDLLILQAYYLGQHQLDQAFNAVAATNTTRLVLGYTPEDDGYDFHPYKEEDLTLFVSPSLLPYFEEQHTMIPVLSHT